MGLDLALAIVDKFRNNKIKGWIEDETNFQFTINLRDLFLKTNQ